MDRNKILQLLVLEQLRHVTDVPSSKTIKHLWRMIKCFLMSGTNGCIVNYSA